MGLGWFFAAIYGRRSDTQSGESMRRRRRPKKYVWERKLPSGNVAYQYERRLSVRRLGVTLHAEKFTQSLGANPDELERRYLLASADYVRRRTLLERELLGDPEAAEEWTVQQFVERVWVRLHRAKNNEKNAHQAERRYALYIDPIIGGLLLWQVTIDDVSRVRDSVGHLAPATQRQVMLIVKGILRAAEIREYISRSPFYHEEHLPEVKRGVPDPMDPKAIKAIMAGGLTRDWHRVVVIVGLMTGLRKSEIVGLRWSDLDERANRIGPIVGKGDKVRYIPYFEPLRIVLADWKRQLERDGEQTEWVVPIRTNSYAWVARSWKRIPRWHLHQTRHTFACLYLDQGGSIEDLCKILGHDTVKTTEIYATISNRTLVQRSIAAMTGAFRMLSPGEVTDTLTDTPSAEEEAEV